MQAANSKHLLPEVMATREMVLGKRVLQGRWVVPKPWCLERFLECGRETIWVPSSEQEEKDEIGV